MKVLQMTEQETLGNKDIRGFTNGLFVISLNTFFYNDQLPGKRWVGELKEQNITNITPKKSYDIEFTQECPELKSLTNDVTKLFEAQNLTPDETSWIYTLLGRTLHSEQKTVTAATSSEVGSDFVLVDNFDIMSINSDHSTISEAKDIAPPKKEDFSFQRRVILEEDEDRYRDDDDYVSILSEDDRALSDYERSAWG